MNKRVNIEKICIALIGLYLLSYYMMLFDFPNLLTTLLGACICILIWNKQKKVEIGVGNFFIIIMITSYYCIKYGVSNAVFMGLPYVGIVMALLGTCLSREARTRIQYEKMMYMILFVLIMGFSLHGFLNSYMYFSGFRTENRRNWYDFWMQCILPATEQMIYFLPVLSTTVPSILYFKNKKIVNIFNLLSSVFFIYLSWISDSRTPIFILPLIVIVQVCLYILLEKERMLELYQRKKKYIWGLLIVGIVYLIFLLTTENQVMAILEEKLGRDGGIFGSDRFKAQRMALEQLFMYPMGGRKMDLGRISYAHNTWLDIANTAGLIPFFAFLFYTIISVFELVTWLTKKDISTERKLMTVGIYGSLFLYYMVERGIEGSMHFMTPWFFINGMIHGELSAIKNRKLEG